MEIFDVGKQQSNLMIAPGKVYNLLFVKYLLRFDIPSETEIKTYIKLMFQNINYEEKKSKRNNDSNNKQSTKELRGRKKGNVVIQE